MDADMKLAEMSKIDKTAPAKTQLAQIDKLYHCYPENLDARDQKMWCPVAVFPSRIHAYSALNLIFSFDQLVGFGIIVTLGAFGAAKGEDAATKMGKWFLAGSLLLIAHLFVTWWCKRFLNTSRLTTTDFVALRSRMKCWFWLRYVVYLFFFIYIIWQAASIFSDKLQTLKKREIATHDQGHKDDKLNRILFKNEYMDGYDTQLIAYTKSFEI